MEIQLTPDKEARLQEVATRTGRNTSDLVAEAVERMLEYDARFAEAVEDGRAAGRRGELIEHADVVERIERILKQ